MKEQFVTYEIALRLKELGFNEECFGYFDENSEFNMFEYFDLERQNSTIQSDYGGIKQCTAPLWQQVIDWLRERYRFDIHITFRHQDGNKIDGINSVYYDIEIYRLLGGDAYKTYNFKQISDNYHYVREVAILKTIELVKNEKSN
jgi:hypothetical protein